MFAITLLDFLKVSFAFLPIVKYATSWFAYVSETTLIVSLIILELKAPANPLFDVIGTNNTFLTSRWFAYLLPESASRVALKLCKSSVNLSA